MEATQLRGPALLATAVNHILAHPETWDQRHWHCNSTHCIAGHCELLGTGKQSSEAGRVSRRLLGISARDANWLFAGDRSLQEIYGYAKVWLEGVDEAGYNRDGYNRAGYDRAGYSRDGYDRDGYDRAGYNHAGYDRDGYSRDGYDRAGYDRAGVKFAMEPLPIPV